ncbi:MAG: glycosyltransferase family 87 protein [Verrucomicrobiota bacterium]
MPPSQGLSTNKTLQLLAKTAILISTSVYFIFVCLNFWGGSDIHFASGNPKLGDLQQHYAAGVFWSKNKIQDLYQGFHLGEWLNQWHKDAWREPSSNIHSFNYVYAPLLAEISSCLLVFSWPTILNSWFNLIVFFYLLACGILIYTHSKIKQLRDRNMLILLLLGFPSFYYTLILFQNNTLTLLIIVCTGLLLNKGMPIIAGLVLSCAFYKPQYMPYFCLFGLFAFPLRFSLALVTGNLLWLGLGILVCGLEAHYLWFSSLEDMSSGIQFQRYGLNQSWHGFFLMAFPSLPRIGIDLFCHALAFFSLILLGLLCRLAPTKIPWQPAYSLYACVVSWLLVSPYVGHYEILLTVPFWFCLLRRPNFSALDKSLIAASIVLISMFSITGQTASVNITSPILTCWFLYSYLICLDWKALPYTWQQLFQKSRKMIYSEKPLSHRLLSILKTTY